MKYEVEFENGYIETFDCLDYSDAVWHVDDLRQNETEAEGIIIRLEKVSEQQPHPPANPA